MKKWDSPVIETIELSATAKNGNNDTHNHKGWCEMHKHPELGICTCGASNNSLS